MLRNAVVLSVALALFAGVYCGGQKAEPKTQVEQMPADAVKLLTQDEMTKFIQAIPAAASALKAAGYVAPTPGDDEPVTSVLNKMVDGMKDVKGLPEALAGAGTNWDEFRGTMMRVMAASAALSADMASEFASAFASDTTAEAKEMVKKIDALKAACANVPAENKQMVQQHGEALQALSELTQ